MRTDRLPESSTTGRTTTGPTKTAASTPGDAPTEPTKPQGSATTSLKTVSAAASVNGIGATTQQWYTIRQAAHLLFREPKTILNLLSKHQLPRRKIRGPGRSHRRIAILSRDTLERLQRLTW